MRSTAAVPRQIVVRPRQPSALEEKLATFSVVGRPSCEHAGTAASSSTAWLVGEYRRTRRQQLLRKGAERILYVMLGLVAACFLGVRTGYSRMVSSTVAIIFVVLAESRSNPTSKLDDIIDQVKVFSSCQQTCGAIHPGLARRGRTTSPDSGFRGGQLQVATTCLRRARKHRLS